MSLRPFTDTASPVGFYFVRGDVRHFISRKVDQDALNRVAAAVLGEDGVEYWIDYYMGPDVHGNAAWANVDQIDRFI